MYSRARALVGVPTGRLPIVPASTMTWVEAFVSLKIAAGLEQAAANNRRRIRLDRMRTWRR
jgi:hypothetical protein